MLDERPRTLMKEGKLLLNKRHPVVLPNVPVPAGIFP
jgi:hypothetical protein